jgi:hypothetical protein
MWQPPTLEEMQAMLPQYDFVTLLGRGGMGAVYKAVQVSLDRPVAIKVLPGDLVMDEDVQFAERFKNEARTMARMSHPGIVNVFDFGETQNGLLYIVMEFIDGTDISKLILSQGRLTEDYALAITAHVCDALNYAHRNGVVHRDIKPANILINMAGEIKVADFGLAKANDASQSGGLTKTNMAMGTPDFVAPEAFIPGFALDGRADLYAIGVMLYQMLTGDIPRGMWSMPSQRIGSDPRFDAIIGKAMQTDREMRYQSASEIRQELDAILTTPMSVLLQQQQAAAEAAAQAAQAQKPAKAAAPPTRGPAPPSAKVAAAPPPPPKPRSSLGPVLGLAATVAVGGAVYLLLGGGGAEKQPNPLPTPVATQTQPSQPTPTPAETPTPPEVADSAKFAGVQFPRDLMQPKSTAWQFEGDALICANTRGGEFPAFTLPEEAKNGFECELTFTFVGSGDSRYLKVLFPTLKGWSSVQVQSREVITFPNGERSVSRMDLGNGAQHTLRVSYGADSKLVVWVDGTQAFDLKDEGVPSIKYWENLRPGHVHIGGETKEGPPIHLHSIRLTPGTGGTPPMPQTVATIEEGFTPLFRSPTDFSGWTSLDGAAPETKWDFHEGGFAASTRSRGAALVSPEEYENFELRLEWKVASKGNGAIAYHSGPAPFRDALRLRLCSPTLKPDRSSGELLGIDLPVADSEVKIDKWNAARVIVRGHLREHWVNDVKVLEYDVTSPAFQQSLKAGANGNPNPLPGAPGTRGRLVLIHNDGMVCFRNLRLRKLEALPPIASPPATVASASPAMAPSSSPTPPADVKSGAVHTLLAAHPQIAKLETGFRSRYETDAQKPYLNALTALNQSYVTSGIARARAAAQAKGSLADVTALDAEKAALEKGEGVPVEDNESTPAALKTLRGTYRAALAKITSERDAKAAPLYDLYLKALDTYIADLTKSEKTDDANHVNALRSEIASQKPLTASTSVATSKPSAPASPSPTPPTNADTPTGSTWRTAAEFLLNNGGSFVASTNGTNFPVSAVKDIPAGRFDIIELNLDRLNSVLPPLKDKDLLPLVGLRDLRRVWVRPSGSALNDGAFAFLAGNDELNWLNLEGVNEVTDEVLPHLASAKKLDFLAIQYAPKFTGKGMDLLPFSDTLTGLDLLSCGISDEGLKAISTFKQLRLLRITSGTASDKDFTILGGLKTLTNLTASTTGFGNKAAEAISTLTGLTRLDLAGTKITNSGLEKLQSLKNLTELILTGTEVSAKAAADFQKALPQCRVSR